MYGSQVCIGMSSSTLKRDKQRWRKEEKGGEKSNVYIITVSIGYLMFFPSLSLIVNKYVENV